jgi:hypothetical protein
MWDDLKRPATFISFVVLIISVIAGILTSLYFYNKGQKYAYIEYSIEQVQVFDQNTVGTLPLTIRDPSGNIIDKNIYAANVTIWNSGNSGIKDEDIREPFRLVVEGNSAKVIEITPVYYTRNNIDEFNIDPQAGNIKWKHFDAGEGFKLRVIYTNTSMAGIIINGYVIDTPIIDYDKINVRRIEQGNKVNSLLLYSVGLLLSLCLVLIFTWAIQWASQMFRNPEKVIELRTRMSTRKWFVGWHSIIRFSIGAIIALMIFVFYIGMPIGKLPGKPF